MIQQIVSFMITNCLFYDHLLFIFSPKYLNDIETQPYLPLIYRSRRYFWLALIHLNSQCICSKSLKKVGCRLLEIFIFYVCNILKGRVDAGIEILLII